MNLRTGPLMRPACRRVALCGMVFCALLVATVLLLRRAPSNTNVSVVALAPDVRVTYCEIARAVTNQPPTYFSNGRRVSHARYQREQQIYSRLDGWLRRLRGKPSPYASERFTVLLPSILEPPRPPSSMTLGPRTAGAAYDQHGSFNSQAVQAVLAQLSHNDPDSNSPDWEAAQSTIALAMPKETLERVCKSGVKARIDEGTPHAPGTRTLTLQTQRWSGGIILNCTLCQRAAKLNAPLDVLVTTMDGAVLAHLRAATW